MKESDLKQIKPFRTSFVFDENYEIREGVNLTVNRGGTSSGKTYSILQVLILKCFEQPGVVITVVGQDIPNLKKGAIRDIFSIINSSDFVQSIIQYYNKTDRILKFKNGSIIEFNSYDDEQDAKNGKRDYSFFNEVNGIREDIFEAIYVRTKIHTWVDFNPSGEFWLTEKKVEERSTTKTIKSTYEHNPFLDQSIIKKIESYKPTPENIEAGTADEYRWKVYGKGEYAALEGAILKRWKRGKFDDSLSSIFGIDWGYKDPFTLVEVAINYKKKIIYVRQRCYAPGLNMKQIKRVVTKYVKNDELIVCDSAEPLNIRELDEEGFNVVGCWKAKGSVVQGLRFLQEFIIIVEDSSDIENELNNYVWADKKSETPVDKFNHTIDPIRYCADWYRFNMI